MIVLGIDPGTASTGYGVIAFDGRDSRALAQGTVRTGPRETPERRLAAIQGAIQELIAEHAPVAVALESLFIGANPRTIMSVCQARGAALAVCGAHGIACTEYAPSVVKTTVCGFGGAGKEQVMRMVRAAALAVRRARERSRGRCARARPLPCLERARRRALRARQGGEVIASVAGRLLEADADGLVIEVGGVGLRVHASAAAARDAQATPEAVRLQTHLVVREDALTLYGFASQRERWLFVALLGVSGLGPSKALALLSGYPTDTLQRAIAAGDLALLASVSGIGKRTAERIVVELRDKLGAVALESVASGGAAAPGRGRSAPRRAGCPRGTGLRGRRGRDGAGGDRRLDGAAPQGGARGAPARRPGVSADEEAERLVGADAARSDEDETDRSLRPRQLEEFVGQEVVREQLAIALAAAKERGEPIDHVLLAGPPGLGKSTLAHIVAAEMDTRLITVSGPGLDRKGDLVAILADLAERDVVFIDEVHRLNRAVEETLYPAMEDGVVDIIMGQGPGARSLRLDLSPFTLIGATTRASLLTKPLRDRFGLVFRLDHYSPAELVRIAQRSAGILGIQMQDDAAAELAQRARGTPRLANRLLRRVRDFAQVRGDGSIDHATAVAALDLLGVDAEGLDRLDRELLRMIAETFEGGPVGLSTLADAIGEDRGTIEDVYEPYLLQKGLLQRTPRGRVITRLGRAHLGHPDTPPSDEHRLFG